MKLEYLNAISCKLMDSNPAARPLASEAMAMLEYATFPMESYFMKAISFLEFVNPAV